MTTIATQLSSQILNAKCSTFRFVEGGTLILYLTPNESESSNDRLWIDCAWRLRKGRSVQIGSLDDSTSVLETLRQLEGCTVEHVTVADDTGDLRLSLNGDLLIETFGYAVADEHWEFRRSDGFRIGVGEHYRPYQRIDDPD